MNIETRARLICGLIGAGFGFAIGYLVFLLAPSSLPFPLFLPVVFTIVFAALSVVLAEYMFPVLLYVALGILAVAIIDFIAVHWKT